MRHSFMCCLSPKLQECSWPHTQISITLSESPLGFHSVSYSSHQALSYKVHFINPFSCHSGVITKQHSKKLNTTRGKPKAATQSGLIALYVGPEHFGFLGCYHWTTCCSVFTFSLLLLMHAPSMKTVVSGVFSMFVTTLSPFHSKFSKLLTNSTI